MNNEVTLEIKFEDSNLTLEQAEELKDMIFELIAQRDANLANKLDFVICDL